MAGALGRVLVGGKDRGAGFSLAPGLVVTANHVVRDRGDKPVAYVPAGGEPVGVEQVQADVNCDAAVLRLAGEVGEFLPAAAAARETRWRVESPPQGANDPELHGTVTTVRMTIQNAADQRVTVVQLEVDEQLGDFGGYSGSAVLDPHGRAVALLVEQKPLRTAVSLGERQAASNVLYAVPIGDVIIALGLHAVRVDKPLTFDVEWLPEGMVTRPSLLDEAAGRVVAAGGQDSGAGLVLLRGPGGVGKTVLARQVAGDARVWAEFADGIIMLRAGQAATADAVGRQLQERLGNRDRNLADVLAGHRVLLIVDDVWDQELLRTLRANLPATIAVLATTRGVSVRGAVAVRVGAVDRDQAIEILARGTPRNDELDRALGRLAETLFGWALLLTLAAAELHHDDEIDLEVGDDDSHPEITDPGVLLGRAETLRAEFPDDPTMLDELERTPDAAPPRSIDIMVRRSLDWLGPEHQARFELLAIYPAGAAISLPVLEDLWETARNVTPKVASFLVRAGLARPVRGDQPAIELHDLIAAWLHHERGRHDDARNRPVHQRLAGLCQLADGSPGNLTKDRADWLSYHLVAADAWDRLRALPTLRWRRAFLAATGSDAAFLAGLDYYGHGALAQAPDPVYHAARAWLFAAHVTTLIGRLPISLLAAMAQVLDPVAAITQASQHPDAEKAVPAVLAAVADRPDIHLLLGRALTLARDIPSDWQRAEAMAAIAERLAAADPSDPALIDQALAAAGAIADDGRRAGTLAGIAGRLAAIDPARAAALADQALAVAEAIPLPERRSGPLAVVAGRLAAIDPARAAALLGEALALARTISSDGQRGAAMVAVARRLAAVPPDPALIDQALTVAQGIPYDQERGEALAAIAERLAAADPQDPALIDQALTVAGTIPGGWLAGALAGVAGRLAAVDPPIPALIDKVLAVAQGIAYDQERGEALAAIAGRLAVADPARAAALIDQALTVAGAIPDSERRAGTLAAIAGRLAAIDPARAAALIDQARAMADTIPDEALAAVAERLAAADPPDPGLIDKACATAETIADGERRAGALAAIAGRLAVADPARAAALIDQARATADTMPDEGEPGGALAAIAEMLAAIDPARAAALIDQILTAADTIPDDRERGKVLAAVAGLLADPPKPTLTDQLLAVPRSSPSYPRRAGTPAAIAGRLAAIDPARAAALIDLARATADAIPYSPERGRALAAVAELMAAIDPARAAALVAQALAVTHTVPDWQRDEVLAAVAGQLAATDPPVPALLDQALAVAETIADGGRRAGLLAAIAQRLAAADPARAARMIDQALTMADVSDWQRGPVLATVARQLAAADPPVPALLDQALAVAGTVPRISSDAALAAIAEGLAAADPSNAALIDQALTLARSIFDDWPRYGALAAVAGRLAAADPMNPALIDRALAIARSIAPVSGYRWRCGALAMIAERLAAADPSNAALIDQALAIAGESQRTEAPARIHALTRTGMLDELSRWRLWSLRGSIELLTVFLGNSHDDTTADSIGLAVLEVAVETSMR